jgi:four helix bundle protein
MDLARWEDEVPLTLKRDALWRMRVYRLSLFLSDLGWPDVILLSQDRRTFSLSDQLNRALGSISSNVAEGYSRGSGRDRARFYEYALGSARESRDWYYKARYVLGPEVTQHRLALLSEVIRLLLTIIPCERSGALREEGAVIYDAAEALSMEGTPDGDLDRAPQANLTQFGIRNTHVPFEE